MSKNDPHFKHELPIKYGPEVEADAKVNLANMFDHLCLDKPNFMTLANCDAFKKILVRDLDRLSKVNEAAPKVNYEVVDYGKYTNGYKSIFKEDVYLIVKDYYERDGFDANSELYKNINHSIMMEKPWLLIQIKHLIKDEEFININNMKTAFESRNQILNQIESLRATPESELDETSSDIQEVTNTEPEQAPTTAAPATLNNPIDVDAEQENKNHEGITGMDDYGVIEQEGYVTETGYVAETSTNTPPKSTSKSAKQNKLNTIMKRSAVRRLNTHNTAFTTPSRKKTTQRKVTKNTNKNNKRPSKNSQNKQRNKNSANVDSDSAMEEDEEEEEQIYLDADQAQGLNDAQITNQLNIMSKNQIQSYNANLIAENKAAISNIIKSIGTHRNATFEEETEMTSLHIRNNRLQREMLEGINAIRGDQLAISQRMELQYQNTTRAINNNTNTCNELNNAINEIKDKTIPDLKTRMDSMENRKETNTAIEEDQDSFGDKEGEELGRQLAKAKADSNAQDYNKYCAKIRDQCELELKLVNYEFIINAHHPWSATGNKEKLGRFLGGYFKIGKTRYNDESKKFTLIVIADYADLYDRTRACNRAFELRRKGRTRGIMGINWSFENGDRDYNKDTIFNLWRQKSLIKNYAKDSNAKYYLILNNGVQIQPRCPKLLADLRPDQITNDNLMKLKYPNEYFIATDHKIHSVTKSITRIFSKINIDSDDMIVDEERKAQTHQQTQNHITTTQQHPSKPKKRRADEPGPSNGDYDDQIEPDKCTPEKSARNTTPTKKSKQSNFTLNRYDHNSPVSDRFHPDYRRCDDPDRAANQYYESENEDAVNGKDYIDLTGGVNERKQKSHEKDRHWNPKSNKGWFPNPKWSYDDYESPRPIKETRTRVRHDSGVTKHSYRSTSKQSPYSKHMKSANSSKYEKNGCKFNHVYRNKKGKYLLNGKEYRNIDDALHARSYLPAINEESDQEYLYISTDSEDERREKYSRDKRRYEEEIRARERRSRNRHGNFFSLREFSKRSGGDRRREERDRR